jgi:hypothetical protein
MQNALAPYRRITIKIGSALLVDGATGKLRADWLASLAADLAALKARGRVAGDRLLGRHRARPAPAQSRCQGQPAARAEPGRRQRRADRPQPGLGRGARPSTAS